MRTIAARVTTWCAVGCVLCGQSGPPAAEATAPEIPGVVAEGTKVQLIQTWDPSLGGEGPVAMPDGSVLFSQQNARKIIRVDKTGMVSTYLDTAPNQVLALAYDLKGRLIGTHRGQPTGVVVLTPMRSTLADTFEGQPFGRPNDLVVDRKGGVYFTDNSGPRPGQPPPPAGSKPGIYYIKPDGQVLRVSDALPQPNGIQLSPDEKVMYVGAGAASFVTALDVQADARVINPRDFAQVSEPGVPGGADGMAMDTAGRLYVAANGGIKVFSPRGGQPLGTIPMSVKPSNLAFAGPDRKTLFVVSARGALYKIVTQAEGVKGRAK